MLLTTSTPQSTSIPTILLRMDQAVTVATTLLVTLTMQEFVCRLRILSTSALCRLVSSMLPILSTTTTGTTAPQLELVQLALERTPLFGRLLANPTPESTLFTCLTLMTGAVGLTLRGLLSLPPHTLSLAASLKITKPLIHTPPLFQSKLVLISSLLIPSDLVRLTLQPTLSTTRI